MGCESERVCRLRIAGLSDDPRRDKRQLAIIDMQGRAANRNPANPDPSGIWWGAASGKFYACQGNTLAGREVITAMAQAYEQTVGSVADRLMAALIAADCAGGDHRGRLGAGIRIAKKGHPDHWLELYVDESNDAVIDLAKKYIELDHPAKGDWFGGKPPFRHPCRNRNTVEEFRINYDESKVPNYKLPDPLTLSDGTKVKDADTWMQKRRPQIFKLFEEQVYGKSPAAPEAMTFVTTSLNKTLFNGKATRKEITVYFTGQEQDPNMTILIYIPNDRPKPVPAFIGLNFRGNHSIYHEPGITLAKKWTFDKENNTVITTRALESERGSAANRWPVEQILERGFAVVTIYYCDIDPDYHDGFKNGVHPLSYAPGQSEPAPDEWGSISAWSWGPKTRRRYRPFTTRQNLTLDRRPRPAFCPGNLQQFRLWRWRSFTTSIRRNR